MRTLLILFLLIVSSSTLYGQLTTVKLHDWIHEGLSSSGNWTVSADSMSVSQSLNDVPTFFVSPDTFQNVTIRGSFKVTGSDDDYIGFVFGYLRPDSAEEYFDFYLLDWKGNSQAGALEGFTLTKVKGIVDVPSGTNTTHPYWDHMDTTQTVLGTYYADTLGWARNVEYNFELIYEPQRVRISIDSSQIFDISGEFRPGRFGFYNYSQPGVTYQGFRLNEAPIAVDDLLTTPEDSVLVMHLTLNDTDADGHDKTITRVGQPLNGQISFTAGDSLVFYKPGSNFYGADSFYYHISDGNGGTDSAKVIIMVHSVNDEPVRIALIPDATISNNSANFFHVMINDYFSDVDANDALLENISVTSNDDVVARVSSDSLYLRATDFVGFDTLFVKVADDSGAVAADTFVVEVQAVTALDDLAIPRKFALRQNYPNPFNPATMISYQLAKNSKVTLKIFDISGREITTLIDKNQPAGEYSVNFDASGLASGVYIYRLQAGSFEQIRKMMLIR